MSQASDTVIPNPPRLPAGRVLFDFYTVGGTLKCGPAFQVIYAEDMSSRRSRAIRVLDRSQVTAGQVMEDIQWLAEERTSDNRHALFCGALCDPLYYYLIFDRGRRTLQNILDDPLMHLTNRHVREIAMQTIEAVANLHAEGIVHTDISPENIELVHDVVSTEFVYNDYREFVERRVIASSEIRLVFYGKVALSGYGTYGTDQYRAPEIVYGKDTGKHSDVFSIGLLILAMKLGESVFPVVAEDRRYLHHKTILYDALLGPFPDEIRGEIHRECPGVFSGGVDGRPVVDGDVSSEVRSFVETGLDLEDLTRTDEELELLSDMLRLDPEKRVPLKHLNCYDYFYSETD